ncbi:PREDICTED: 2-oxoglutarate dehydrogenase, mitochondrial-like isoform X1 [Wasmannia auropunctata]|uniref:2-oxoglutarate dehydrogenase, mitochondrial-like isoform X1 n=1 Tax=Wasmannia auropunctata TaxID=64793 RepID=UPI0005EF8205|nr:PREDICTED: 2-oxoglutarate dehydrogenase, mitochondrial-like isoform X1 [Wasmannia auropunctata]
MYAKAQCYRSARSVPPCLSRRLAHYLHTSWKNLKCGSVAEQFHKNIRHKHDDNRKDNVLNMINNQYLDHMYKTWLEDRKSVSSSWDSYFKLIHAESRPKDARVKSISSSRVSSSPKLIASKEGGQSGKRPLLKGFVREKSDSQMQGDQYISSALDITATIRAYQARGHLIADTDPLGIQNPESAKLQGTANLPPEIVVRQHLKGMTEADMDREFPLAPLTVIGGDKRSLPLREILKRLNEVYCGHLGLEYTYIHDLNVLDWLRDKFEIPGVWKLPAEHRKWIWMNIMRGVSFENFLAKKYGTEKRFGLEGCESFIPSMAECIETSALNGVETVIIGMAHRGRLNTLANICSKPMSQLFTQFNPIALEGFGSGDVKYHLGTHSERLLERSKKRVLHAVMANASHLEAIDPVIVGRVRAEQVEKGDAEYGKKSLAILVHGDAAFSGQGVVYETMHLTDLPEYTTGGVIHVVINNQIGFTTDPRYSRSSVHCTDVARVVNAPIFHVHADDPDLVTYCSKVASEYRATFHNDVVVDVVGYRRRGHNEMDEPMLTQPLMYKRIKDHPSILSIYTDKLLKEGVITEAFAKEETEKYLNHCEEEFAKAQTISSMQMSDWHDVPWTEFYSHQSPKNKIPPTGIDIATIKTICTTVSTPPKDIEAHLQVLRAMDRRTKLMESRQIDWAMGECLAFLSLLKDGHHVRLSGQDVERGTFTQRIHIVHDQSKDKTYKNILRDVFPKQALYTVSNSSLSEYGVCGFELGYSAYNHNTLTVWEAQFGDFANTCQVILDCLLCSGQSKWGRQVGLVLLLPHGLEGQGPEHSSARLERFLQLCDDDCTHVPGTEPGAPAGENVEQIMTRQLFEINWIVANPTTPASLFHLLRRQILMPFRKPLVLMTPKSLLRHPMAISNFEEIGPGTSLKHVLPDPFVKPGNVKKVLLCTGKVYYDLVVERQEQQLEDKIAIIRIEQLCPFPYHPLAAEMTKYPGAKIMWLQEEHKNQGAYSYVRDRIALALGIPLENVKYGGRPASAAPATGSKIIYKDEHYNMLANAMKLD